MQNRFILTIFCCLLLACQKPDEVIKEALVDYAYQPSTNPKIHQVENQLSGIIPIEGHKAWNIIDRMKHYRIPGVSIAVIHDFKIDWAQSYGYASIENRESLTEKTLFGAGSLSKFLTGLLISKLAEEQKIELNRAVNSYLTSWRIPNTIPRGDSISLEQLLSHTAGITIKEFNGYSADATLPTLLQVLNGQQPANTPPIQLKASPKGHYEFASGGYAIVQQCLSDVFNMAFENLVNQQIVVPLKLTQTTFQQPVPIQFGKMAQGYAAEYQHHSVIYPEQAAKGLWTTPTDFATIMAEVMKALKGKKSIYKPSTAKRLMTPRAFNVVTGYQKYNPNFWISDYGLGVATTRRQGKTSAQYFTHGGERKGFKSKMIGHLKNGYGAIVMVNAEQSDEFIEEVLRAIATTYQWEDYLPYSNIEKPTKFLLHGYYNVKKVSIAGSFNYWRQNELMLTKGNEKWEIDLPLPKGKYMYKFIIDDTWVLDPENQLTEIDENTENSLIEVK